MSLSPGTTYYFRVKAINSDQESEYSEVVSVTTLTDANALISVSPASNPVLFRVNTFTNKVEVLLEQPSKNEGIQEYKVTLSTNADFSAPLYSSLTYVVDKNTAYAVVNQIAYVVFTVSNLAAGTTYYLRVRSVNKISSSGNTDTSFSTDTVLNPPVAVGVTNLTAITARANWNKVSGATSYVLDVDDNANFSSPVINALDVGDAEIFDIPVLIENTKYYYRLRAKAGAVLSKYSNVVSFTTLDDVETFNDLTFDLANPSIVGVRNVYLNTFELRWYPVERAVNYTLDLSTSVDFSTFVTQNISTTETKYLFSGLSPGTVYYVRIKANHPTKSSGYTTQTVTTLTNNVNLSVPQLLTPATILSTGFVLTWVKRNYASRYLIQISALSNFSVVLQSVFVGDVDSYVIDKLTPSTTYYVRIYALSSTEASNVSNTITVTTAAVLPNVTLGTVSDLTDNTVRLTWTLNAAYNKYRLSIYKKIDFVSITEGKTNFLGNGFFNNLDVGNVSNYLVDLFLEPSTVYSYVITGMTANGDTKESIVGDFTTKAKAPVIQISNNGKFLEWSGTLTRIEVSTDKDFKTLVQGWHPRTVPNTGSFNISNLVGNGTCYYFRGYDVINGVIGTRSNITASYGKTPLLLTPTVTKTTAYIQWVKNTSTNYNVQLFVDNAGTFIPVSGHTFPINLGDVDYFYVKDLSANTNYALYLSYYENNKFVTLSLPIYFKTNRFDSVSELTTNGAATTASITNIDFDRFRLNVPTTDTYLVELSKRSDFLTIDRYFETNASVDVVVDVNTPYYLRVYRVVGSDKTTAQVLTVTTTALPAYGASLSTAPTIASTTVLNETELVLSWNTLANASGYTVEISDTNTFNLLDKTAFVTFIDNTKALVTGLVGTKVYYARVYAYNAHSISAVSNVVTLDTTP